MAATPKQQAIGALFAAALASPDARDAIAWQQYQTDVLEPLRQQVRDA